MSKKPDRQEDQPERLTLGRFLSEVNLRDFSAMVATETKLIPASVAAAWRRGPVFLPVALVVALVRGILLALVIVVFGGGILLITLGRAVLRRPSS